MPCLPLAAPRALSSASLPAPSPQHSDYKSVTESIVPAVKANVGKAIDVIVVRMVEGAQACLAARPLPCVQGHHVQIRRRSSRHL